MTDQISSNLQAINLLKIGADITRRQSSSIEANDLIIHAIKPSLALLDQFRRKTT